MEYFFPEDRNISLLAEATTAVINKQTTTNFTDHKKLLVQFDQQSKDTPDYLFFNIRGSGTTSTNPEGYLVFYGVKEWMNLVPSQIYDRALETGMFEYENGQMKMNMDLDLNGFSVVNAKEDFFTINGYYDGRKSNPLGFFYTSIIPFNCYLMEVYGAITSIAPGNDYKFLLTISSSAPGDPITLTSNDNNPRIYRFTDVTPKYFSQHERILLKLSYPSLPLLGLPKFTAAKFTLRFFRVD